MLISKIKYRVFLTILALLIININFFSKNTYLKYSPSEDALFYAVNSVIIIGDKPSSIGLTFFKMKGKLTISSHKRYDILLKELHPTLNGELKLTDFTHGSTKKLWWKCNVSDDHEWEASIVYRVNGNGCPCCFGSKVVLSNCLATTHPNDSKQWHPTKNQLTPFDVVSGSHKKIWWKCNKANDHEWEASIKDKIRVSKLGGCPCCRGIKIVLSNCLDTTNPKISEQWHPTKNLNLTPFDVSRGSDKKVWWKCNNANDHEWESTVKDITNGHGCPYCYDSIGEKKVKSILNVMNINYEVQKKFNDCKHKKKLPFDFYLPKHNILIEYDGKQHFKCIEVFGGVKAFNGIKKRDKIKNEYAAKNNIPLLRIPYTKFNLIEEEIKYFLNLQKNKKNNE